jgi:hypothetical protein
LPKIKLNNPTYLNSLIGTVLCLLMTINKIDLFGRRSCAASFFHIERFRRGKLRRRWKEWPESEPEQLASYGVPATVCIVLVVLYHIVFFCQVFHLFASLLPKKTLLL